MKQKNYMLIVVGLVFLGMGFYLLRGINLSNSFLQVLPYVFIGLGCGIFGHGAGELICQKAISKDLELKNRLEIEKNDERNIAIANRAKSKAYDIMTFVFGALMISFALMNVDLPALLLLVFAYLFVEGSAVYYTQKYHKEM